MQTASFALLRLTLDIGYDAMFVLGGLLVWKRSSSAGMAIIAAGIADFFASLVYAILPTFSMRFGMTPMAIHSVFTAVSLGRNTVHYGGLIAALFALAKSR